MATLEAHRARLAAALRRRLEVARTDLERLRNSYAFRMPLETIRRHEQRLDDLVASATLAVRRRLESARERLATAEGRLRALSPLAVLERGYSVTRVPETGRVLRSADQAPPGTTIETILHAGKLLSKVQQATPPQDNR